MREAIREAEEALRSQDQPVGAVIVHQGRVVARAHHQVKLLHDPTAHAVLVAITQAANALQSNQLRDTTVYTTLEPCAMCVGALFLSEVSRLVYGATNAQLGACGTLIDLTAHERLNRHLTVVRHVLSNECQALLRKVTTQH